MNDFLEGLVVQKYFYAKSNHLLLIYIHLPVKVADVENLN